MKVRVPLESSRATPRVDRYDAMWTGILNKLIRRLPSTRDAILPLPNGVAFECISFCHPRCGTKWRRVTTPTSGERLINPILEGRLRAPVETVDALDVPHVPNNTVCKAPSGWYACVDPPVPLGYVIDRDAFIVRGGCASYPPACFRCTGWVDDLPTPLAESQVDDDDVFTERDVDHFVECVQGLLSIDGAPRTMVSGRMVDFAGRIVSVPSSHSVSVLREGSTKASVIRVQDRDLRLVPHSDGTVRWSRDSQSTPLLVHIRARAYDSALTLNGCRCAAIDASPAEGWYKLTARTGNLCVIVNADGETFRLSCDVFDASEDKGWERLDQSYISDIYEMWCRGNNVGLSPVLHDATVSTNYRGPVIFAGGNVACTKSKCERIIETHDAGALTHKYARRLGMTTTLHPIAQNETPPRNPSKGRATTSASQYHKHLWREKRPLDYERVRYGMSHEKDALSTLREALIARNLCSHHEFYSNTLSETKSLSDKIELKATPDGVIRMRNALETIIEAKCSPSGARTSLPFRYWLQVQMAMFVWNVDNCYLISWSHTGAVMYTIRRDDKWTKIYEASNRRDVSASLWNHFTTIRPSIRGIRLPVYSAHARRRSISIDEHCKSIDALFTTSPPTPPSSGRICVNDDGVVYLNDELFATTTQPLPSIEGSFASVGGDLEVREDTTGSQHTLNVSRLRGVKGEDDIKREGPSFWKMLVTQLESLKEKKVLLDIDGGLIKHKATFAAITTILAAQRIAAAHGKLQRNIEVDNQQLEFAIRNLVAQPHMVSQRIAQL